MESRYKIRGLEWAGAVRGMLIRFDEDANGDIVGELLVIPSDWEAQEEAGLPYVLGIVDGLPEWRTVAADVIGVGFGEGFGNYFGGPDL